MISASLGLPCSINISFQASRFSCNQSFHLSGLLFLISGHQIFSESLSNHTIPNVGHIRLILPDQLKMKKLSSLCTPTQVSRGFAFAHLRTILAAEGLKQSLGWANNSRVLEVWPPYPTQSRARTSERGTDRILRSQVERLSAKIQSVARFTWALEAVYTFRRAKSEVLVVGTMTSSFPLPVSVCRPSHENTRGDGAGKVTRLGQQK